MKVIVPVDLSQVSRNAAAYAGKVAQVFGAELVLLNIAPRTLLSPLVSVITGAGNRTARAAAALSAMTEELADAFHISCVYEMSLPDEDLALSIVKHCDGESIIVMGTDGAGDFAQGVYGSNTYRALSVTAQPIWVVPERLEYGTISRILFVSGSLAADLTTLGALRPVLDVYSPYVNVLTVSTFPPDPAAASIVEDSFSRGVPGQVYCRFDYVVADLTPAIIGSYMASTGADLLVMTNRRVSALGDIFHPSLLKQILARPEFPLLVLGQPS